MLDGETVIGGYLRTKGFRVVGRTPNNTDANWVRLTQLDAPNVTGTSQVERYHDYVFQLDCYAAKSGYANQLAIDVRAALVDMPNVTISDVAVSRATFQGHSRIPDTDFEPARERVILDSTVRMRPA